MSIELLNENLEIRMPMFDDDMDIIAKLDDEPNAVGGLTAAELKAEFDKPGKTIQKYINEILLPGLIGTIGEEAVRVENELLRIENEKIRIANEAEREELADKLRNLRATAETLSAGSDATASVVVENGEFVIRLGVPKGAQGQKGDKGDQGERGERGPEGPQGATGPRGPQGPKGDTGNTGPQGPKGDTGPQGPQGPQGVEGPEGPQGKPGAVDFEALTPEQMEMLKGDPGPAGEDGKSPKIQTIDIDGGVQLIITNADGTSTIRTITNGKDGAKGENGQDGKDGQDGADGPAGADGVGIKSVVQTELSTTDQGRNTLRITKTDGSTSDFYVFNGSRGSVGPAGPSGEDGEQGPAGTDGRDGQDGQRGPGILKVSTAPDSYTTVTAGKTPVARMMVYTIKQQAGVSDVLVGDTVAQNYNQYHVYYVDTDWAYMDTKTSIRGATGATGPQGPQGIQGIQGIQGSQGLPGTPGFSPVVSVTEIAGGHKVFIEDLEGGKEFDVMDGEQGPAGPAGQDGDTPYIGSNGNWWIGGTDTGVSAGGSGSGGGGVQSDWSENDETKLSHVKGRTHWKEESGSDDVILDVEPTWSGTYTTVTGLANNGIVKGQTYIVTWNDVEYECVGKSLESGETFLGNRKLFEAADDTGEPFAVLAGSGNKYYLYKAKNSDTVSRVKVQGKKVVTYHKMEPGYLPEGVPYTEEGVVELLSATAEVDPDYGTAMLSETPIDVFAGDILVINYNGVEYRCEALDGTAINPDAPAGGWGAGNIDAATGTGDSGEPFLLAQDDGGMVVLISLDGSTSVTVVISKNKTTVYKVPLKYLPEGVGYTEEGVKEILPKTTVELDPDSGQGMLPVDPPELIEGETYIVTWGSDDYTCVAQEVVMEGMAIGVGVGNVGAMTGAGDSGDPFVFLWVYPTLAESLGASNIVTALDGSIGVQMRIVWKGEVAKPVPGKFMPEGTPWIERFDDVVLPGISSTDKVDLDGTYLFGEKGFSLKTGAFYNVRFNGVLYEVPAVLTSDGWVLGYNSGDEYHDLPFNIGVLPTPYEFGDGRKVVAVIVTRSGDPVEELSIVGGYRSSRLPAKLLPLEMERFVVRGTPTNTEDIYEGDLSKKALVERMRVGASVTAMLENSDGTIIEVLQGVYSSGDIYFLGADHLGPYSRSYTASNIGKKQRS